MLYELIKRNRSIRRFDNSQKIGIGSIEKWIELARLSPGARNMQPLKYVVCTGEEMNRQIFPHLAWAGYLTDWKGPEENERPVAYIAVVLDKSLIEKADCDAGIAMQSILLGAVEDGYGGCIIGSVNKIKVSEILGLPLHLEILYMIALGKPAEEVVIDQVINRNIKYWRDENEVHHVPKRPLSEIIYRKF